MDTSAAFVCPTCKVACAETDSTCRVCGNKLPGFSSAMPWRIIAAAALLLPIILLIFAIGGAYLYLNQRMKRSEAYKRSLTIAYNSLDVQKILGTDIHQEATAIGHLETFEGAEFTEWSIPLVGTARQWPSFRNRQSGQRHLGLCTAGASYR